MPEIATVTFCIKQSNYNKALVSDFYTVLQSNGYVLKNTHKKTSLQTLSKHNQNLLDCHISEQKSLDYSHNFLSVLLEGTMYSLCTLQVSIVPDFFCFSINLPEEEVIHQGYSELKALAKLVLARMQIEEVHTSADTHEASIEVQPDRWLAVEYFAYFRGQSHIENDYCKFSEVNDGFFVEY